MTRRRHAAFGVLMLLATGVAEAHHGYAAFFRPTERTVAVEGTLEQLLYGNPHVIMKIRTADSTVYTVTWQSQTAIRRAGVTSSTFAVGDHLIVIAAPSRDPESREVTQVCEVQRPRDGWLWRRSSPFAQPSN